MPGQTGDIDPFDSYNERLKAALNKSGKDPPDELPTASEPKAEGSPFDSYANRLNGALSEAKAKKGEAESQQAPEPETPFDSYAGRLDKQLRKTRGEPPAGGEPDVFEPDDEDDEDDLEDDETDDEAEAEADDDDLEIDDADDDDGELEEDATVAPLGSGPVGSGEYVVEQGDCMNSIAAESGHFWKTIWEDRANGELRELRRDPNVLLKGDRVHIPPLREKVEEGATEQRHRFRRKGEPCRFKVTIWNHDSPRANEVYRLEIEGGRTLSGVLDEQGMLDVFVASKAKRAMLIVGPEGDQERIAVMLGGLGPISEISGIQARLQNLGFYFGEVNDELDEETRAALAAFQEEHELETTGEPDDATRQRLDEEHQ